jgi:hypothetical protein
MENLERIYNAANYAKQDKDLINETFQFDDGKPYAIDKFNGINLSGLFTLLIKEAGRLCDHYASDMFYDLKMIHEDLYGDSSVLFNQDTYRTIIGIRESGVDGPTFMKYRLNNVLGGTDSFTYYYRAIYLIEITPDENYRSWRKLSAYRVSPSSMDFYFKYKERRDYPEMG